MIGPKLSLEAASLLAPYLPEAMLQAGWAEMRLVGNQREFRLTPEGESMVRCGRALKELNDKDATREARIQV